MSMRMVRTVPKDRKSCMEPTWNWKVLVMEAEFDRLQRYSDSSFLVQAKQDADSYQDKIVFKDCKEREAVKKDLLQSGVHSSVHVAEGVSNPGKVLSTDLVSHLDWRWICGQDGTYMILINVQKCRQNDTREVDD